MSQPRWARFAWGVLVYNLAVIVWGAVVRATGSGAGCGRHWPLCNGEVVPRAASAETLIEYSHRATSGLALLAVVALFVLIRRTFERRHPARLGATLSLIFMLGEAAVGASLVLLELVAENESMARALFMALHLCNTFLLVASLALTAHWASGGEGLVWSVVRGDHRRRAVLVAIALAAAMAIGVSGAVAALGDTLYPAASLEEALRQDLSVTSHVLIRLRLWHPVIAVSAGVFLLVVAGRFRAAAADSVSGAAARRWAGLMSALIFLQLAAGGLNVLLLAPVWMQLVHLVLADLLWIALVLMAACGLAPGAVPLAAGAPPAGPAQA